MINLNELGFSYSRKSMVFNGLSLTIPAGRSVGVLGANGVGKTTLLKLIAGMVSPTEGDIQVLNQQPRQRQTSLLQQIYVVPEESELPPMTGNVYVQQFSMFYPGFENETFNRLVQQFDIDLSAKLTERSLGQKKKFLVAFALATGCALILMDEPTNGLDIPSKAQFRDMIIQHQRDDQTILISTHQVRDLDAIIDSVVMMNEQHAHWIDLATLPDQISQTSDVHPDGNVIYKESHFGGEIALVSGAGSSDSAIDMELLFNAFHTNYTGLIAALNGDKQA